MLLANERAEPADAGAAAALYRNGKAPALSMFPPGACGPVFFNNTI